jgi:hypothetical protein
VRRVFFLLIVLGIPSAASADLQVLGYAPEKHDRFYQPASGSDPAKAFIGDPYDWSGIARAYNSTMGYQKWATMISDTHFLSAAHFKPNAGDTLTFYQSNDPSGTTWTGTVTSSATQIGSSDIWLGQVLGPSNSSPPSWVKRYTLMRRPEGYNYLNLSAVDPTVYVVGQSASPATATRMRVGRNELSRFPSPTDVGWTYDSVGGLGNDEAVTQGGDSGGPTFAITTAGLALVGTHSGVASDASVSYHLGQISVQIGESISIATDQLGDVNHDFIANGSDFAIISGNWLTGPGKTYSQGDLSGDGYVNGTDYAILSGNWQEVLRSPADFDLDQVVDAADLREVGNRWGQTGLSPGTPGDADADGDVDREDVLVVDSFYRHDPHILPSPTGPLAPADFNEDGLVNATDELMLLGTYPPAPYPRTVTPGSLGDLNSDGSVNYSDFAIFSGQWEPFGPADATTDGKIDLEDLDVLADNWLLTVTLGREEGDFNGDNVVDSDDFSILADWWGRGYGYPGSTPLPEPTTAGLALSVILAAIAATRRP